MKNISQILIKLLILILIIQVVNVPICNASTWDEIFETGENFIEEGKDEGGGAIMDATELQRVWNNVYNIVFSLGVALSVIVGAVLGIKFLFGSVDEQAKIKEMLIPYVLGCVVIFGAFGIWKIAVNIGQSVVSTPTTSTTYTKVDDKLYCDNCGDELINTEQRKAECSQCGKSIKGI